MDAIQPVARARIRLVSGYESIGSPTLQPCQRSRPSFREIVF